MSSALAFLPIRTLNDQSRDQLRAWDQCSSAGGIPQSFVPDLTESYSLVTTEEELWSDPHREDERNEDDEDLYYPKQIFDCWNSDDTNRFDVYADILADSTTTTLFEEDAPLYRPGVDTTGEMPQDDKELVGSEYYEQLRRLHNLTWSSVPEPFPPLVQSHSARVVQKQREIRLMNNPVSSNTLQSIRAESGAPLENLWFQQLSSFDMLRSSFYPNRVDYHHERILQSLRSGHGDLAQHARCLTCKAERKLDDPPCVGHRSHINLLLPTVQRIYLPKYEGMAEILCQNCSSSLMRTGAVSRSVDRIAGLDPLQPVPLTEEVRQWFTMVDFTLPEEVPTSVAEVMRLKPEVHQAWVEWNSAQVEYMYANQQRNRKQAWPKVDKRFYNRAWFLFRTKSLVLFDTYKHLLVVLPCNWIALYNEHEEYGYQLNREYLRTQKFKSDIFQNAKLGVFLTDQLEEARCELINWLQHLEFLEAEQDRWKRRDTVFKDLLRYLQAYIEDKRERFYGELSSTREHQEENNTVEDFLKPWRLCREPNCHRWGIEESARWIRDTRTRQWERMAKRHSLDTYDFPCERNDPGVPRPPVRVEQDASQNEGEVYCAQIFGGCGSHQTILRSHRLAFSAHYSKECENWHRPFYPAFRDSVYVSPTYMLAILRRALTMPYFRAQRWQDLQNLGYKIQGSRPEALLTEHLLVIPYYLRMMPAALSQTLKVAKQHWTTCLLHIMGSVRDQLRERKKFVQQLGPLEILDKDREDHDQFLPNEPAKKPETLVQEMESMSISFHDEENEQMMNTQSPLYWLRHYASADDSELPWPSYLAQQLFMIEHGLLEPMWVYFKNAKDRVRWHDWDGHCLHPDFMYTLVGSMWSPLTYRSIKNHPALKLLSLQSDIQLKQFEIADIPEASVCPVPMDRDLDNNFMGLMDSRERLSEMLSMFLQGGGGGGGGTSPPFHPPSFVISPALREMIQRELLLNQTELEKVGKSGTRSAMALRKDHMLAYNRNRIRDKNRNARRPTSKAKSAQNKSQGTVHAEMSTKKDRLFSNRFQRWIKGSGRFTADLNSKLGFNEIELPREILMQMHNQVTVRDDVEYWQRVVDDNAVMRNELLRTKLALQRHQLQANEQFVTSLLINVVRPRTATAFIRSTAMWVHRAPPCEVEYVLLSERQKLALRKDDVYPAALQIIRMSSGLDMIDLRRYYTRYQRTPQSGETNAFRVRPKDILIVHSVEGDVLSSDRPPTLQFIGQYGVLIRESTGHVVGINSILWSLSNGDYDGDKDKLDQIKNQIAVLEVLTVMNPQLNVIDVKSGFSVIGMMQDSNIGIHQMATRPEERWYLPELHALMYLNLREVAYRSRAVDPSMKRPFRASEFTESYVARIRQRFLSKVRARLQNHPSLSNDSLWKPLEEIRDPRIRSQVIQVTHETYLTNTEMLGCLVPETFHYVRFVNDDPRNAIRIEIRDNEWRGIPLKTDIGGSDRSIQKLLTTCFGPSAAIVFTKDGSLLGIHYTENAGMSLSQFGAMMSRKSRVGIWRVGQQMTFMEQQEWNRWQHEEFPAMLQRMGQMLEFDPQRYEQRRPLTLLELTITETHQDRPQQISMHLNEPAALVMARHHVRTLIEMNATIQARINQFPYQWFDRRSKATEKILKQEADTRLEVYQRMNRDLDCPPYSPGFELLLQGYSGSKGNMGKWSNLVLYSGLQLIDGNLEKRTFGNRINYYLDPDDRRIVAFGCILESFVYGLDPEQLLLQKGPAHKQVYDSSGTVNVTGSSQKDDSKLFGDEFIDTNRSVRDHTDSMIQLFYNSDGMNPNRAERVHCWMNIVAAIERGKRTDAQLRTIPDRRLESIEEHQKWLDEQPPKWRMGVGFWEQYAPLLDSFWPGHTTPSVEWAHRSGFRLLMHAFWLRQEALRKCWSPPNLVIDTEIQCVDIPQLIRHLVAQGRYSLNKEDCVCSALMLFKKVTDLRYVLWQLDPTWRMLGRRRDTFTPYYAIPHSLDWYLIENLCYVRIVNEYHLTETQVDDLMGAIFCKWRDSRIPMGEAIGILAVQSVYVDQTQGMLNKKHMDKTTMNELTKGSRRWNQLLENALKVPKDHLVKIDVAFYSSPEDREWVRQRTGYQLWDEPARCLYFKEANFHTIVPSVSYERWNSIPHESQENVWQCVWDSFQQFPTYEQSSAVEVDLGSPRSALDSAPFLYPSGFIRVVFDVRECQRYGIDWRQWLQQLRSTLTNSFLTYAFHYPALEVAVMHVFKIELRNTSELTKSIQTKRQKTDRSNALFNRKVCKNVIWGGKRLDSKMKSASVTKSKATVHVIEDESLCLYYYVLTLLQDRFQGVKVKHIDVESRTTVTPSRPLATRLLERRQHTAVDTSWRRIIANIQHTEMAEILAMILQWIQRPDVDPHSLMLIHPAHLYQLFGSISLACNALFLELSNVHKDLGSPVLGCHTRLIADSVTKSGSLIRFNTIEVSELNNDILTMASHRKTLYNMAQAALGSKRANKHSTSTRTLIALPLNKGTSYFTTVNRTDNVRRYDQESKLYDMDDEDDPVDAPLDDRVV